MKSHMITMRTHKYMHLEALFWLKKLIGHRFIKRTTLSSHSGQKRKRRCAASQKTPIDLSCLFRGHL